jgi:hypothetical protein
MRGRGRRDLQPGLAACVQSADMTTRAHDVRSLYWAAALLKLGSCYRISPVLGVTTREIARFAAALETRGS